MKHHPLEHRYADEAKRHERQAELMAAVVQRNHDLEDGPGAGLHRKQIVELPATFTVNNEGILRLPASARVGLFERAKSYKAMVRLTSSSPSLREDDAVKDTRGFSIKVYLDDGREQDFLLITTETQFVPTSDEFVLLTLLLDMFGLRGGLFYVLEKPSFRRLKYLWNLYRAFKQPFAGFAFEKFFSGAAISAGESAVRIRLSPPSARTGRKTPSDLRQDYLQSLASGDLTYKFELQLYRDPTSTPIENASINWKSDYIHVASLTIDAGSQPLDSAKCWFDAWNCLEVHRPLGELMRARKAAYAKSRDQRGAATCPFSTKIKQGA